MLAHVQTVVRPDTRRNNYYARLNPQTLASLFKGVVRYVATCSSSVCGLRLNVWGGLVPREKSWLTTLASNLMLPQCSAGLTNEFWWNKLFISFCDAEFFLCDVFTTNTNWSRYGWIKPLGPTSFSERLITKLQTLTNGDWSRQNVLDLVRVGICELNIA